MARLDGKVALITGAGTGIGRATARAMAAEGAKVVVAEINAEAGEQNAQIVAQAGGDCIAVATDVTQEDSTQKAVFQLAHPVVTLQGENLGDRGNAALDAGDAAFDKNTSKGRSHSGNGRADRVVGANDQPDLSQSRHIGE